MTAMVAAASGSAAALPSVVGERSAVQQALDTSAAAWSAGDLGRFMTVYEKAPTTTYVSGTRVVQGYDAIRAMYAERFGGGSSAKMGSLSLEILDFRPVGTDHAYVVGRFHLHRATGDGGDASGLTTLLFHKKKDGWRIVADHS